MNLIIAIIFVGVFAVIALLMSATSGGSAKEAKQVIATLDSALAASAPVRPEQVVNLRKNESLSAIPWINNALLKVKVAPRLRTLLAQADLKWTAGGLLLGCALVLVVAGYAAYLRTHVVPASVGFGVGCAILPIVYVFKRRGSRFSKFEKELPDALDLMVSALRVGHSLNAAIGLVTREAPEPIKGEFRICFDEQNYGLEMRTAMENLNERVPLQDLRIVTTAIMIQKESGGNLAEVLEKTSHVIRERFRLKRQIMTHTAQGRLTGMILTALPIFLGIALYFVNPASMSLLWTREVGVKLLYASATMTIIGGLIINKIVNMEV